MNGLIKFCIVTIQVLFFINISSAQHMDLENKQILWTADWNENNNTIAVGGNHDSLMIFSGEDFVKLKSFPFLSTITSLQWHPTKNILVVAAQGGTDATSILNLDNHEQFELDSIHEAGARAAGWNRSGDMLAIGDYNGYINIYNEKGDLLKRISTEQKAFIGLSWHPNDNIIVAVGEFISIYNVDTQILTQVEDRDEDVLMLCVSWHPSGEFFATGDYGDYDFNFPPLLQYWSSNGENLNRVLGSKAEYRSMSWSPDGATLATASDGIRIWDIKGNLILKNETEHLLWGISRDRDNNNIVSTDFKGNIIIWDKDLNLLKIMNY